MMPGVNVWTDDQSLVQAVLEQDQLAQQAFYDRFSRLVNAIAWRFARVDCGAAKDLAQEAWTHLFTRVFVPDAMASYLHLALYNRTATQNLLCDIDIVLPKRKFSSTLVK